MRVNPEQLVTELERVAARLERAGLPVDAEHALLLLAAELIEARRKAGSNGFRRGR